MKRFTDMDGFLEDLKKRRQSDAYNGMMRIGDISRLYRERQRQLSGQDGLPCSYRMLLFHLAHMRPGVTQLELVKAAHLKPPTVSVTLQKMERDGLVIRRSNEKDLRQTLVYLSEKGQQVDRTIRETHADGARIALEGFTPEEHEQLCHLLDRVIDNLVEDRNKTDE